MTSFFTCDPNKKIRLQRTEFAELRGIISKVQDRGLNITNTFQEILFICMKQRLLAVAAKNRVLPCGQRCDVMSRDAVPKPRKCCRLQYRQPYRHTDHTYSAINKKIILILGAVCCTVRCERPEYTGCLAKKEQMNGRISLTYYCAVVEYIF
jgi:hypothetical protein